MSEVFDFLVVGGGIAGASAAWRLAQSGRTLLIEMESDTGYHSTGRSAACFMEGYGQAQARALTCASRAFFEAPPEGFSETPLLSLCGALHVAPAADPGALDQMASLLERQLSAFTREDIEATAARVPILRPEAIAGAVFETDVSHIDVDALLQGFLRGVRRNGEVRKSAPFTQAWRDGDGWIVRAGSDVIACKAIVNAGGAWADEVARRAGARAIGLSPLKRTAIIVDAPENVEPSKWPLVISTDESFYFKPEGGRIMCSPCDETPAPAEDSAADDYDVAVAVDRLQSVTTLDIKRVRSRWAGLRTFAPDRAIVAGEDPAARSFFWMAGQGGCGVQTAPALGEMIASLVVTGAPPPSHALFGVDAEAIAPSRFA